MAGVHRQRFRTFGLRRSSGHPRREGAAARRGRPLCFDVGQRFGRLRALRSSAVGTGRGGAVAVCFYLVTRCFPRTVFGPVRISRGVCRDCMRWRMHARFSAVLGAGRFGAGKQDSSCARRRAARRRQAAGIAEAMSRRRRDLLVGEAMPRRAVLRSSGKSKWRIHSFAARSGRSRSLRCCPAGRHGENSAVSSVRMRAGTRPGSSGAGNGRKKSGLFVGPCAGTNFVRALPERKRREEIPSYINKRSCLTNLRQPFFIRTCYSRSFPDTQFSEG